MSSNIWTPEELSSKAAALAGRCWRIVEAQHQASTMKVTDTVEEQETVERLIEETKPPIPPGCDGLDFLLMTPFRYSAVNPYGTRFRKPNSPDGVFYAAEHSDTAIAELAFYRLLFFAESPQTPWPANPAEYTAFAVEFSTDRALDLTAEPFAGHLSLYDLVDYSFGQELCIRARVAQIAALKYKSVRDPAARPNIALLSPRLFSKTEPVDRQSWKIHVDSNGVRTRCEAPRVSIAFGRETFSADSRMKDFVWQR